MKSQLMKSFAVHHKFWLLLGVKWKAKGEFEEKGMADFCFIRISLAVV